MNWSQYIFTNHTFVQYDSILIVVTFPRHVSNQQVFTQSQLTFFRRISFCQNLAFRYTLTNFTNRTKVNRHILIRTTPLRNTIFLQCRFEAYKFFVLCTIIQNTNNSSVHKFDYTITFSGNLRTRVANQLTFDACTYNRSFTLQQRNCLAHHVWPHQRTVSIIMFQERNQRCSDWSNLLGRNVHQLYFIRSYHRIVSILTSFYFIADESTIIIQRCITLSNNLSFLFFRSQICQPFIRKVNLTVFNLTIWSFNETKYIDLSEHAQRRNQTNVRTFRRFNWTKTTIVSVVNVTYLKSGTLTRQTTRTESRHTTFVRNFSQRIRLVHKLRQSIRSKEWIDYGRNSLGVDQINRSKHFIIAYVHTFTNRTRHTSQTNSKLIRQLLSYSTYTTVTQMVNIIHIGLRVNQLDQVLNDFNNIFLRKNTHIHISRQIQLLVNSVATYITQVISLFREEQVIDNLTCTGIIGRVCITQLAIDIQYSFLLRVTRVFLERVIYNRIVRLIRLFLVYKNVLNTRL